MCACDHERKPLSSAHSPSPAMHLPLTFIPHTTPPHPFLRSVNLKNTTPCPASRSQSPVCSASLNSTKKPRTVGIAGAGLAGLATALTLLKTPGTGVESVSIFEPRESLDTGLGGPLNINGAAAILVKCYGLDVRRIGHPTNVVTARAANGRLLFDINVGKLVTENKTASDLLTDGTQHLFMTVMRDSFQSLLYDALKSERVVFHRGPHRKVANVKQRHGKASFVLANGEESELFDLVVGADGLRSNVRIHVAGKTIPPRYSGLRLQWAISPRGVNTLEHNRMEQWFGNGGYVLRYAGGPEESLSEALAFTFREDRKAAENPTYKGEDTIRIDFERRLVACGMPAAFSSIAQNATSFIETGIYYHHLLPTWSAGGVCVLVGDAAHAMPPFLGQGANQAIQDAQALAVSLSKIGQEYDLLDDALNAYQSLRKGPVQAILEGSRLIGNLETQSGLIGMAIRDNLFRVAGFTGAVGQTFLQSATPRVGTM